MEIFVGRRTAFRLGAVMLGLLLLSSAVRTARADDPEQDLCNHSLSDPDAGIPACTRLIERDRDGGNSPGYYNNRGVAKVVKADFESAIKDFTSALERLPNFVDAFRNRGLAQHMRGDYDAAVADFTRALKINDKSAPLYNARGTSLVGKDEHDLAIADFDRAIQLDNRFAKAFYNRGQAWFLKKQLDRAIADFNAYIKLAPSDSKGYIQRADARVNKGDFSGAIKDYDSAIAIDPSHGESYSHRGEARRLQGDLGQALADHDKAIELDPVPEAYVNRALAWGDRGRFDRAIADCSEALLYRPKYDLAFANRGRFRRLAGDLEGSLADLDKALGLNPRSFRALGFRGDTLLAKGDSERALTDFDESIQRSPDFVAAYTGRGLAFEKKGAIAKAKADFEKALQLPVTADAGLAKPAQEIARARLAALAVAPSPARPARETAETERKTEPERRVALVIGNSNYRNVANLPNPQRDADAVAASLRRLGFQTVMAKNNLALQQFRDELKSFKEAARDADWAMVFYAGHGIQVGGKNYLIPVDATLRDSEDVDFEAINLEIVQEATQKAKKLHLVMLDACRNNPFENGMRVASAVRSIGRGFARIEPENGTYVAYAAKDGQEALDGDGEHSPFTTAFLKYVVEPRLEIDKLFRKVRDEVHTATRGKQLPFTYGSLPGSADFYFTVK